RMAERLGIVYTPVQVVDFILHSVAHLLHKEFGRTIGDKDVRILDPFTGTGTFIARLIQSGLIADAELKTKYLSGLYANEIVLLAYYIAAINIETAYHARAGGDYQQFLGISLADTFLMAQKAPAQPSLQGFTMDNTVRRHRQDKIPINVIIGNPPYSVGQGSQNDNNQNLEYPALDERIKETYAAHGKASLKRNLYDSYIRALRWASDRLDMAGNQEGGIIGFVTNAGWLDSNNADGLRKCLADEFSSIYIFHLRGDIRKNMLTKGRAKEGENIFGSGSMAGIAISFFVKNPQAAERGKIHYFDIGDDLSREEKLQKIATLASTAGIDALPEGEGWQHITPNVHGDWLRQRDDSFSAFIPLGDKKGDGARLFDNYSLGVVTNRDAWVINASRARVERNMRGMIDFYNSEVQRFDAAHRGMDAKARKAAVDSFIDTTPTRISWTRALKGELAKGRTFAFEPASLVPMLYRPFTKQWFYFNRSFNEMVLQMPLIFPAAEMKNTVIQVSGVGAPSFFTLITDVCPDHGFSTGIQCFPLYLYEPSTLTALSSRRPDDTPANGGNFTRRDAITDAGLQHFQQAYPGETISKEDIFYYVYGLLHSPDYRARYADNLSKELPRIPRVKTAQDFWAFSKAGRELARWHLNYETCEPWPLDIDINDDGGSVPPEKLYRVEKMKHPRAGKEKDKTTIIYNHRITVRAIPPEAWEYIVNGKAALDWVIERQCLKTDKASTITNDANDWACETMHNPRYPLDLLARVTRVSMETIRIVKSLPPLDI
ncbi:MAG: DEAD/DEAH box helicase, partial [Ottowia sp.]|nr:DEAD/DEAH box helicase [Ottowia sp.]